MGLTITDEALAQMIRDLAERKGVSVLEAVREAVRKEAEREAKVRRTVSDLLAITEPTRHLPRLSGASDHEILGYDEHGLPG